MGTDIHFHVERLVGHEWQEVEGNFYDGRSYDLFAILGNVRNGRGFAGCDTGDGFVPLTDNRGFPLNASKGVKEACEEWGDDGHSHSHCTLAELLAYDWTQTTKKRGFVDVRGWIQWRCQGSPNGWSGDVWGSSVAHLTPEEFESGVELYLEKSGLKGNTPLAWLDEDQISELNDEIAGEGKRAYAQVEWEVAYYDSARNFLSETMPKLWRLGAPEDVRLVFWFDS